MCGSQPESDEEISGGYCDGVPPLPIPNREVKPVCADGTAMQCGRVGGRLFSDRVSGESAMTLRKLFFCVGPHPDTKPHANRVRLHPGPPQGEGACGRRGLGGFLIGEMGKMRIMGGMGLMRAEFIWIGGQYRGMIGV